MRTEWVLPFLDTCENRVCLTHEIGPGTHGDVCRRPQAGDGSPDPVLRPRLRLPASRTQPPPAPDRRHGSSSSWQTLHPFRWPVPLEDRREEDRWSTRVSRNRPGRCLPLLHLGLPSVTCPCRCPRDTETVSDRPSRPPMTQTPVLSPPSPTSEVVLRFGTRLGVLPDGCGPPWSVRPCQSPSSPPLTAAGALSPVLLHSSGLEPRRPR